MQTRITPNTDTFHVVAVFWYQNKSYKPTRKNCKLQYYLQEVLKEQNKRIKILKNISIATDFDKFFFALHCVLTSSLRYIAFSLVWIHMASTS